MGHQIGSRPPQTASWRKLVAEIAEGSSVAAVAAATMRAAIGGIAKAYDDPGLTRAVYLLARIAQVAREVDFAGALNRIGIVVSADLDVLELSGAFSESIQAYLQSKRGRTDFGEMADLASVKTLNRLIGDRCGGLYGTTPEEVQAAARAFSTHNGFGLLYHEFFTEFSSHFLTYHLSRELSDHVGGNGRFATIDDHSDFLDQVHDYCREAASPVREFAADWFRKHRLADDISPQSARHFANYCLTKLKKVLLLQGGRDGE